MCTYSRMQVEVIINYYDYYVLQHVSGGLPRMHSDYRYVCCIVFLLFAY